MDTRIWSFVGVLVALILTVTFWHIVGPALLVLGALFVVAMILGGVCGLILWMSSRGDSVGSVIVAIGLSLTAVVMLISA